MFPSDSAVDKVQTMHTRCFHLALLALSLLAGCSNFTTRSLAHAWSHWQQGSKRSSVSLAKEELERFVEANDLLFERVKTTATSAYRQLDETLVPDNLSIKQPNSLDLLKRGPASLAKELRQDLGSDDSLPVMRALQTVQSLGLQEHALSVLAIIYRRKPYADRTNLFGKSSQSLRSVSVKWTAYVTMQSFLSKGPGTNLSSPK